MPTLFRSRKEFSYWFDSPLTKMIEVELGPSNSGNDAIMCVFVVLNYQVVVTASLDLTKMDQEEGQPEASTTPSL